MLRRIYQAVIKRMRYYKYQRAVSKKSIEERFTAIYKNKLWYGNKESASGAGSTLDATKNVRNELTHVLNKLNAKTLLDIGCGDFNWMKEVNLPCNYIGIDIVEEVIEHNVQKYANEKTTFLHCNAVTDSLPKEADVALCREVFFHLSFEDIKSLFKNLLNSNVRYLIATSSSNDLPNKNIRTGGFRDLNLMKLPTMLKEPVYKIDDNYINESRFLGVWEIERLRSFANDIDEEI